MKVSHEVPVALIKSSPQFNHYDYCLPHLLDQNEDYLNYFKWAKENDRYIIMDNSLHELGHAYDTDRLLHWVEYFEPNEFIVPDVWQDMEASLENAAEWAQIKLPYYTTKVAVVQAKSIEEASECYTKYKMLGYRKIAFSYGANYYQDHFPHPINAVAASMGRVAVISKLFKDRVIDVNDRVHLLGCAAPQEFNFYHYMPFVETIDTSNPIMAGIEGLEYNKNGILSKPKIKIDETMGMTWDDLAPHLSLIYHNVYMFKKINNIKQ